MFEAGGIESGGEDDGDNVDGGDNETVLNVSIFQYNVNKPCTKESKLPVVGK